MSGYVGVEPIPQANTIINQGTIAATTSSIFVPNGYNVGNIEVFLNGLRLKASDFTATDGVYVNFAQTLSVGTDYIIQDVRNYQQADVDSRIGNLNAQSRSVVARLAAEAGFNLVDGSFEEGGSLVNPEDVLWYRGDGKYYSWFNKTAKSIAVGSTPAASGGIGAGAWVDRTDLTLRAAFIVNGTSIDDISKINTPAGASKLKTASGFSVQDYLNSSPNIIDVEAPPYNGDLVAAYNAIPSTGGYVLRLGLNTYNISNLFSNSTRNVKPNVSILGAGMPAVDYANRKLVVGSGTILYGSLYNTAIGFKVYNLGIDCGDWARVNKFSGSYKDAFVMIDFPRYSDISYGNLRILESDVVAGNSASNTHCHLVENGGEVYHGFLELIGGYHGYVNKALNVNGTTVISWGQSGTHAIFKSDAGALCNWAHLDCLEIGKDGVTGLCSGVLFEADTQQLSNISIGTLKSRDTQFVIAQAAATDSVISGVHIGELISGNVLGGSGATAAVSIGNKMVGFSIGRHDIEQSALPGIEVRTGAIQTDIGGGRVKNCTGSGYIFNALTKHGNIWSLSNTAYGVINNGNALLNAQDIYCAGNTSGGINQVPIVSTTLQNSWVDGAGTFRAAKYGSTIKISGLLTGGAAGSGYGWQTIAQLASCYPEFDEYISATGYTAGGAPVQLMAKVTSTGAIQVYGMGAQSVIGVAVNGNYTTQANQ